MNNRRKPREWDQRPGEPNPSYVAFVLYLSLGPRREQIIDEGVGRQLWRLLMAGIDCINDDTPLPLVCDTVSVALNNMLREDALLDQNAVIAQIRPLLGEAYLLRVLRGRSKAGLRAGQDARLPVVSRANERNNLTDNT